MNQELLAIAEAALGFMPVDEGLALYEAALAAPKGPLLEVGSYCGRSTIFLGAAAAERGQLLFAVDHHRGSEECQAGWEHHDSTLADPETGLLDTLKEFRKNLWRAGLEPHVVAVVGDSLQVGALWATPLGFLFIDGGHSAAAAHGDFDTWVTHLMPGGILAIHDVFADPKDGGRPPYEIYLRALRSKAFAEVSEVGSLRILARSGRSEAPTNQPEAPEAPTRASAASS